MRKDDFIPTPAGRDGRRGDAPDLDRTEATERNSLSDFGMHSDQTRPDQTLSLKFWLRSCFGFGIPRIEVG